MIQTFDKSAQALFAVFKNSEKIFYSLSDNDLSAFQGPSENTIFRHKRASSRLIIEGPLGVSPVNRGHENPGNSKHETRNTKQIQNPNDGMTKTKRGDLCYAPRGEL
jgi:hypothetical protein